MAVGRVYLQSFLNEKCIRNTLKKYFPISLNKKELDDVYLHVFHTTDLKTNFSNVLTKNADFTTDYAKTTGR